MTYMFMVHIFHITQERLIIFMFERLWIFPLNLFGRIWERERIYIEIATAVDDQRSSLLLYWTTTKDPSIFTYPFHNRCQLLFAAENC